MKFCVNCRHYIPASEGFNAREHAKCGYRFPKADPVLGGPSPQKYTYCYVLRASSEKDVCGTEAQFYDEALAEEVA